MTGAAKRSLRLVNSNLFFALMNLALISPAFADAPYSPYRGRGDLVVDESGSTTPPLTVNNCHISRDGKPYRGIGVNYMTMLYREIEHPNDKSGLLGLRVLASHHIPFVRFSVLPLNANEMKHFIADFSRINSYMDPIVSEAESLGIGLVPSVFFDFKAVPNSFHEPISAWGDPNSKTSRFSKSFSKYISARYAKSNAIWMWEFTNEANTWADIADAHKWYKVSVRNDTPESYSIRDDYTTDQLTIAFKIFSQAIKDGNPSALVETGNDIPRNSAFNRLHGSPKIDGVDEFVQAVGIQNAYADVVSMHIYPFSVSSDYSKRFMDRRIDSAEEFIPYANKAANAVCKPLFIGEFGVSYAGEGAMSDASGEFSRLLEAIVDSGTDLAAMWVYDLSISKFNSTYSNNLSGRLYAIEAANEAIAKARGG